MNDTTTQPEMPEMNVDFENFSLPKERSDELRTTVQKVKEAGIVDSMRSLAQELGVEEVSSQEDQVASLVKAKNPKVFRYNVSQVEGEREMFEVYLFDQELRCVLAGKAVLEVSFLPKDKDFILFYVDSLFLESWPEFSANIAEVLKEATKIKGDRQKHFKKFQKKEFKSEDESSED